MSAELERQVELVEAALTVVDDVVRLFPETVRLPLALEDEEEVRDFAELLRYFLAQHSILESLKLLVTRDSLVIQRRGVGQLDSIEESPREEVFDNVTTLSGR